VSLSSESIQTGLTPRYRRVTLARVDPAVVVSVGSGSVNEMGTSGVVGVVRSL
jgi:hypothetical protein